MRGIILPALICLGLLGGCATIQPPAPAPVENDLPSSPYAISFTIRAGVSNNGSVETRRVTGLLWGNPTGPVRMDLSAGIGALIARTVEEDSVLYIHIPEEKRMVIRDVSVSGLNIFGYPMPFRLHDLAKIAHGCFTPLTDGTRRGQLTKGPSGLPVKWQGGDGWNVEFVYGETAVPKKIKAVHEDGSEALIIIKQVSKTAAHAPEKLILDVPQGTRIN